MFVSKLFLRGLPLLIFTHCIPLEQLLSHSHLNYTLYFCLQPILTLLCSLQFFPFLKLDLLVNIFVSVNASNFTVKYGFICGCCFETFISKVHAWARNLDVESRKQRKTEKKKRGRRHSHGQGGGNPKGLTWGPGPRARWGEPGGVDRDRQGGWFPWGPDIPTL